ncbi:hypothetical protein GKZ89_04560 [Bacillus mangrovi]|uniref:Diphthamide synthase domain-containing protein n=1 Tax=Metabacillus mangrovi TaxID=1491830 RepID=A0A7X2S4K4_9BACI|nr:hypothetical protein [Metabacillus mangrovi]
MAFECIEKGYKATVCGIDSSVLPAECLGMPYSHRFLERLPEAADPCGENGEFHTFVSDGPIFNSSVKYSEDGQDDSLAPFLTLRLLES